MIVGRKHVAVDAPGAGIPFADTHCHVPWTEGKPHPSLPSPDEQVADLLAAGGQFAITCSIDMASALACETFARRHEKVYFSCGMAPQTVTYTREEKYNREFGQWLAFIDEHMDSIVAFGEIGLDFHHAKTMRQREAQVRELDTILDAITTHKKPIVLHVRNAGPGDVDKVNETHPYNGPGSATTTIVDMLDRHGVDPARVLFHCYSGPVTANEDLVRRGFTFSVPSSAFGFDRWYKVSASIPLGRLVTETDAPFQHPTSMGPVNVPANARHAVAAIARSHGVSPLEAGRATVGTAMRFFGIGARPAG